MPWLDIRDGNRLKRRLQAGEIALGCFQRIGAPEVADVCAAVGFDFVVVDLEHGLISEERAADLVRAAEAAAISPLVRVAGHDPVAIGRLLEVGPAGLHVPRVRSAEEAARAVAATRYAPAGVRGLSAARPGGYGARLPLGEYVEASREWLLTVVQVEDRAGLAEIEAIAALDGVDVVFVGLTDLSQDLGVPGAYDDPALVDAAGRAVAAVEMRGKVAGVPVADAAMASAWIARGARYLAANDVRLLLGAGRAFVDSIRR